ncbi:hypothetical protein ACIHAA_05280 [Streptomyces sp. NPDC052040]|uniref:Rv1733c family protein n=1 Tax=Streptomyces sp. NPDC052040 TaxID=3365682 RepID=UPI0037D7133F
MRAIRGLWRWRSNPLRRPTDLAEAWLALVALVVTLIVVPVAGAAIGTAAQDSLQRSVRDEQRTRHLVAATVVRSLGLTALEDPDSPSTRRTQSRVLAHWTAPDGTPREGTTLADLETPHRGDRFAIWTDEHGRITPRPLDRATATSHALLAGVGAAAGAAGLVECGRLLILWRMRLRRYALWDQAWNRTGPDWGRTEAGS